MDINLKTLTLTLFGEARSEPIEGVIAVGSVIRNRVQLQFHKAIGYEQVCRYPYQFTCWNKNDPNLPILVDLSQKLEAGDVIPDIFVRQCLWVANGIINWNLRDNSKGSTHYLTNDLYQSNPPKWAMLGKVKTVIGNHTFIESQ